MNINEYKKEIVRISRWKGEIYKTMEFQLSCNNDNLKETIDFRKDRLTEHDRNYTSGLLSSGYFNDHEENFRIACFCVGLEANYQSKLNRLIADCSEYVGNEPIFDKQILRENRNGDLIDYRIFSQREPLSNIFKVGDFWGYFDRRIPAQIYEWIEKCFANRPCRIRVEPQGVYKDKPKQMLIECQVLPPQFKWWEKFDIYAGNQSCSEYILLGNDVHNYNDYYDYNTLNIRRLEVFAERRDANYISMLIEEIEEHINPVNTNEKYVIGRMIHLDSNATIGTSFRNAILNHIDLAFNLYVNEDAVNRMDKRLWSDERQEARPRTHILRIENIPFISLLKLAGSFFKSKTLLNEWLSKEFI